MLGGQMTKAPRGCCESPLPVFQRMGMGGKKALGSNPTSATCCVD